MTNSNNLRNLNKLLKTISKINQKLLTSADEKKLSQHICNYLVQIKDYKLVWLGLRETGNKCLITPTAIAGDDKDFVKEIKKSWDKYGFNGCPTSVALKSGNFFLIEDLANEKRFVPWDKLAVKKGFLSAIVLPLKYYDEVIGSLHIYSDVKNHFIMKKSDS